MLKKIYQPLLLAFIIIGTGCKKNGDTSNTTPTQPPVANDKPEFKNRSNAESFVIIDPAFTSTINAYTLLSSSDVLAASPNFVYGGAPDGQGFLKNPDGTGYVMVTNHENTYAISRVFLDKKLNPVRGEYILNTDGGLFRLCSGTLATPEEHGFAKPVFLSTGESNANAMTHAIDPLGTANPADQTRVKPTLGKHSGENSVPLPKDAYTGKTVIVLSEDSGNGQVYLYVSNTVGDLDNGTLYALRRTNLDQIEKNMTKGNTYNIEFVEVPNAKNLTGTEIENLNSTLKSMQFARVEDVDYRKGGGANSREVYFTATGVNGSADKTKWGRVYRLKLDASSPLLGTLEVIEDGDINPGQDIVNPDNLCVTTNYVYIQEDGDSRYPEATHNSLIWQHTIADGSKKKMIDLKNKLLGGTKYNYDNNQTFAIWEHGAMIDISNVIGEPDVFLINIQAHTWADGDKFLNPSKAISVQTYKSGGQTLILKGVPR
jgi:hypothetical protein